LAAETNNSAITDNCVVTDWSSAKILDRQRQLKVSICIHEAKMTVLLLHSLSSGYDILEQILFLPYTADILGAVHVHLYADDLQVYGSCRPSEVRVLQDGVSACIDDVAAWMKSNRVQLNDSTTEVLWSTTSATKRAASHWL